MRNILSVLDRWIFPRKCIACKTRLNEEEVVFCNTCRAKWILATEKVCYSCRQRQIDCRCRPESVRGSSITEYRHLLQFQSRIAKPVISALKHHNYTELYDFIGKEFLGTIRQYPDIAPDNSVICYCPRRSQSVRRYGIDQSKTLAQRFGGVSNIPVVDALRHSAYSSDQKNLDAKQRYLNALKSYALKDNLTEVIGKNIILVDDVVTTGATAEACAKLLKTAGAEKILFFSVAKTERYHRKTWKKADRRK